MGVPSIRSDFQSPAGLPPCNRVSLRGLLLSGAVLVSGRSLRPGVAPRFGRTARPLTAGLLILLAAVIPAGAMPEDDYSEVGRALRHLFDRIEPSVVQVVAYRPIGPGAGSAGGAGLVRIEPSRSTIWATGVVLDRDGLILTCAEAAQPGDSLEIRLADGRTLGARFLAQEVSRGVSLIQANQGGGLVPVARPDSVEYSPGDWMFVFSYDPDTGEPGVRLATLDATLPGPPGPVTYLRVDLNDCHGTCGGVVVDGHGRFQGVLVQIRAEREMDADLGGTGCVLDLLECERVFALSVEELQELGRLLKDRSRTPAGFLGVRAEIRDPMNPAAATGAPPGDGEGALVVVHVLPGSPAEAAGIRPGDQILAIQGRPVSDVNEITESIAASRPGTQIDVRLLRNGAPLDVQPRLCDRSALEWLAREEELNQVRQTRVRRSIQSLQDQLRHLQVERSRFN